MSVVRNRKPWYFLFLAKMLQNVIMYLNQHEFSHLPEETMLVETA